MSAPALAKTMPDGSRRYQHPATGERVPSVTTIMKVMHKGEALTDWAARMVAQHAAANWDELTPLSTLEKVQVLSAAHRKVADVAADKGNMVHEVIDKWAKGEPMEAPKAVKGQVDQFVSFMMMYKPVFLETEVTLWSRKHGYAGTADWIAKIGDETFIGDNKTGKRVYDEVGLQLSALRHAEFIIREDGSEEPIPHIDGMMVLHIRPRGFKLVRVVADDSNWSAFLGCRAVYDWIMNANPVGYQ